MKIQTTIPARIEVDRRTFLCGAAGAASLLLLPIKSHAGDSPPVSGPTTKGMRPWSDLYLAS